MGYLMSQLIPATTPQSSPITAPSAADLPRQFSITIERLELMAVYEFVARYSPTHAEDYIAIVSLQHDKRVWFAREANVVGYRTFSGTATAEGFVAVTLNVLTLMHEFNNDDEIVLHFDLDKGTYRFNVNSAVFEIEMPRHWEIDDQYSFEPHESMWVDATELGYIGRALMEVPINPELFEKPISVPFAHVVCHNNVITAHRNWALLGGPDISCSIPVKKGFPFEISFFGGAVAREMYYADTYLEQSVAIQFSDSAPHYFRVKGDKWGFVASMGHQYVVDSRADVIEALTDEEFTLENADINDWDPTVVVAVDHHNVVVDIVPQQSGVADFVRVTSLVMNDAPRTLQLAEEMNSWNNTWVNSRLVRQDNALVVIAEVPISTLEILPNTIRDVVSKTRKVSEVVGVFM